MPSYGQLRNISQIERKRDALTERTLLSAPVLEITRSGCLEYAHSSQCSADHELKHLDMLEIPGCANDGIVRRNEYSGISI